MQTPRHRRPSRAYGLNCRTPEKVSETIRTIASQAAHLARVLQDRPYPAP